MESLPLISVITVVRNGVSAIQRCVESVTAQTYPTIEHIIIDGASTDGTVNLIRKLETNNRISFWQSEPDTGIYNAMNKALVHARGDWVHFLGADDFLHPEFSEMAKLLKNPQTVYYGQCSWGEDILGGEFDAYKLTREGICHHSILYPANVFRKYRYSEKYKINGDHLLNLQVWSDKAFNKQYQPLLIADFGKGGFSEYAIDEPYERDFSGLVWKYCSIKTFLRYKWRKLKSR